MAKVSIGGGGGSEIASAAAAAAVAGGSSPLKKSGRTTPLLAQQLPEEPRQVRGGPGASASSFAADSESGSMARCPTASDGSTTDASNAVTPHSSRPHLLGSETLRNKLQWYGPPRRMYTRRELLADRIVNFTGAGLSWVAAPTLGYLSWAAGDPPLKQLGFWMHGFGLVTMLTCSALYHHWSWDWGKAQSLLSLDHVGISSMIMGCYAPLMLYCDCPNIFIIVCALGVVGFIAEALRGYFGFGNGTVGWSSLDKMHVVRYLVMGWACIPVIPFMITKLPIAVLWLSAAGGIMYTVGVWVFIQGDLEFHLPIWHGKVLVASALFYCSNVFSLVGIP